MKYTDLINISISNIKSNKFKTIIFILIITLFMTLITCFFTFKNSLYSFVNRYLNSDFNYKLIQVDVTKDDDSEYERIISIIEKTNNKHITKVFKNNSYLKVNVSLDNQEVELYGNYTGFNYKVTKGKDIKDKYDIVCPNYMTGGDWTSKHNINDYINMIDKIGNKFHISFNQKYVKSSNEVNIINNYDYDLNLVGTYDTNEELTGYNKCYISTYLFEKLSSESEIKYSQEYLNSKEKYDSYPPVLVLVDDFKNVDTVMKVLENASLNTYIPELDLEFYETIFKYMNFATIIIVVASVFSIYYFIKSTLIESIKNIALYQVIGYNLKDIKKIYIIEYIIKIIISLFISFVISIILKNIGMFLLSSDPNYSVLKLSLSLYEVLIYLIIIIVIIYLVIKILFKKIAKEKSLIYLTGE